MNINVHEKGIASRIFDICNILFMILVVLATLYPLYHVAVVSLSDGKAVLRGEVSLFPVGFTLSTYSVERSWHNGWERTNSR